MGSIPTVSILIPTFQYGHFLNEAIDSVINQDYQDFELVISDDGSRDNSAAIIQAYALRDKRIRYIIQPKNIGMVNNWNYCLGEARGKYIKYVFADDSLLHKESLGKLVQSLEDNPQAAMASCARQITDENSTSLEVWSGFNHTGFYSGSAEIDQCIKEERNLIGEPSAVIFRRSYAARFFDTSFKQLVDQEMWFHLLSQGGLFYTNQALCSFRKHSGQQTALNKKNQVTSAESTRIMARYYPFFKKALIGEGWYVFNNRLFKHIYYARKDSEKTEVNRLAQQRLLEQLTLPGYWLFLFLHRASKPFINLMRSVKASKKL